MLVFFIQKIKKINNIKGEKSIMSRIVGVRDLHISKLVKDEVGGTT